MRALDLFSGIGGIALAAEWAGIETAAFCEIEPYCRRVLSRHWPGVPIYEDVRELTRERLERDGVMDNGAIDLICGGYPCQPFSVAGKRRGAEDDRHLWPEMFRLVQELRPAWVLGENVAGHIHLGLDDVLADLESEGYSCRAFVLPACAVGAPHRRDRVFIVAHTESPGLPLRRVPVGNETEGPRPQCESEDRESGGRATQSRMGRDVDGVSTPLDRTLWPAAFGEPQYEWEPPRVATGIQNRVPRLKALGNAVVPQQVYPILRAIREVTHLDNFRTP